MRYILKYPVGYWTGKKSVDGSGTYRFAEEREDTSVKRFWFKSSAIRKASQIYKSNKQLSQFEIVPLSKREE